MNKIMFFFCVIFRIIYFYKYKWVIFFVLDNINWFLKNIYINVYGFINFVYMFYVKRKIDKIFI